MDDEVEIFQAQSSFPTFDDEENKDDVSSNKFEDIHIESPSKLDEVKEEEKVGAKPKKEETKEEE